MSAVDFNAIAQAIATRFNAANITAPTGETAIRSSTSALPSQIAATPAVLVFPPTELPLSYAASARTGRIRFPVRFYIAKLKDQSRNTTLLLKWLTSLYAALPEPQVHLGLSSYVTHADITNAVVGKLTYGGMEYEGIELEVTVYIAEGMNPTA